MKRTWVKVLGFSVMLITAAACKNNPDVTVNQPSGVTPPGSPTVTQIQVANAGGSGGPFIISTGQTLQLVPTALDANNATVTGVTYAWSSSSSATATVSNTGLVTGVAIGGPITIHATSGSITSNDVSVTVSCAGIPSNAVTPMSVTLNPASPMSVNAVTSVTAAVFDCTGQPVPDNTTVTFTLNTASLGNLSTGSSLASTISVPTAGGLGLASASFVAGPSAGQVTITATAGTLSASVTVDINALPVLGIQFLSAVPQVVGVKGSGQTEVSEVSFSVTDTQGHPFGDGLTVNFQFLSGMNPGGQAQIDPPAAATVGGVAKTFLKSGFVAGPVRILAYVDVNGSGVFDSGDVYSTSTELSIGGGVPSARFFSISADKHNLAGLAYDNEQANVNVNIADRFGNYNVLAGTTVSFYTEAGAIDRFGITNDKGQTTVVLRTQNPRPMDTDPRQNLNPIGNEIFLYNNLNANGHDTGEVFEDRNGNGINAVVIQEGPNKILDTTPTGDDYTDQINGRTIIAGRNHTANTTATGDDVQNILLGTQVGYDVGEHFFDVNGSGYDFGEPNPRDGWVTVLAVTMGEERFYDVGNGTPGTAGNGLYDPGEPFDDNGGEPFIDANDNGIYDGPEVFIDMNNNGSYDFGEPFYDRGNGEPFSDTNGNGVWDAGEPFTDMNGNFTYDGPGDAMLIDPFGVAPGGTAPCLDKLTGAPKGGGCVAGGFYDRVYDPGEFFVDIDGDGKWTPPNGKWDSNTAIWVDLRNVSSKVNKSQTFAFTGPPHFSEETSKIVIDEDHRDPRPGQGSQFWIHNGQCASLDVYVADVNNNALIGGTTVALAVDAGKIQGGPSGGTGTLPEDLPYGPYVTSLALCDDDSSTIKAKGGTFSATISWQPQGAAAPLVGTMTVGGTIDAPYPIQFVTTSLPNTPAACGAPPCYSQTIVITGGAPAFSYTVTAGSLPPSFTLDLASGLITQTGNSVASILPYNFTVLVTDSFGLWNTEDLSILVN